ncbi:hypothetical protein BJ741DRAFT_613524 [Chytriomyces cf. hyalinus JEL632]|nr:hypothetical protein BJ741DRAFT_613524 [Chytriomyces cf. hyalinus JEL632]
MFVTVPIKPLPATLPHNQPLRDDLVCVPDSKMKVMDDHGQFHASISSQPKVDTDCQRLEQQLQNLKATRADFWNRQWELLFKVVDLKYKWAKDESCFCLDKTKGCIPNCSDQANARWELEFRDGRGLLEKEIRQNRCQVKIPNENDCRVSYHLNSPPSWESLQLMKAICCNFKDQCASMKRDLEVMDEIYHVVLNSCPSPLNAQTQLLNQMRRFNVNNQMLIFPNWWSWMEWGFTVPGTKVLKCLAASHKQNYGRAWCPELCTDFVFEKLVTKNGPFLSVGCGYGTFESALAEKWLMGWKDVFLTDLAEKNHPDVIYPKVDVGYRPSLGKYMNLCVDATKLHCYGYVKDWVIEKRADILFNCPWRGNGGVSKLICDFLMSAGQIQHEGSYVFVGITEHESYLGQYDIPTVLKNSAKLYKLRHIDNEIIKTVRHAEKPYRHFKCYGKKPTFAEDFVYPYHVMLCFERLRPH